MPCKLTPRCFSLAFNTNIFFRTAHLPLKDYWGLNTGPLSCWTSILSTSHISRLPFRYWMGKISAATLLVLLTSPYHCPYWATVFYNTRGRHCTHKRIQGPLRTHRTGGDLDHYHNWHLQWLHLLSTSPSLCSLALWPWTLRAFCTTPHLYIYVHIEFPSLDWKSKNLDLVFSIFMFPHSPCSASLCIQFCKHQYGGDTRYDRCYLYLLPGILTRGLLFLSSDRLSDMQLSFLHFSRRKLISSSHRLTHYSSQCRQCRHFLLCNL